jgi:hypothetical protein
MADEWDGNRVRGISWRGGFGVEDSTSELRPTHLLCATISSANGTTNLTYASWKAPRQTKEVIEAEEDYLHARNEFETAFEYAGEACLSTP